MSLKIELGEDPPPTRCECCGAATSTAHGFVYEAGDARAIYYAGWSAGHPDRGVTMAIAIGDWDEGADASKRVSIGLAAYSTEKEIQFSVLSPENSPWGRTDLLGRMLPRSEALRHPLLQEAYAIAEHIATHDGRVADFLGTLAGDRSKGPTSLVVRDT
jgi:hypothetical protein